MKILIVAVFLTVLAACNRDDRRPPPADRTPGQAAGHAAYEIQKDAKKAAKEMSKDLKSFAHDARQGFQDAKQKDVQRKDERREMEKEKDGR